MEKEREKDIAYLNDMLVRFEEIFYHELSGCARPKAELIGSDFLQSKKIRPGPVEKVIDDCAKEIKAAELVRDISYSIHGFGLCLKLNMKGCIHLPKEVKLKSDGVEPYVCPIANMILDRILTVAKYETAYLPYMKIDTDKGECALKCAIYETIDKIGQVSDWTKF